MGNIEDYRSGAILDGIRKALSVFDSGNALPIDDERIGHLIEKIRAFEPMCITIAEASIFIRNAKAIAHGERVCRPLHPGSELTQSVFLDELAEAMILSGSAEQATAEEAEQLLQQSSGNPLIISMISGRYQEICASHTMSCVYWRAEKRGVHCLKRRETDRD
ncbi:MAG: hypothetical protein HGB22_08145 [Chlorobiaceae bacterium]|nr:hypothetical protein [Chlorobiaceae bacterium]